MLTGGAFAKVKMHNEPKPRSANWSQVLIM